MNFPSAQCHTPSHFNGNHGGLLARALDRVSKDTIKGRDCSSEPSPRTHQASPFLPVKWALLSPLRGGCEDDSG